MGCLVVVTDGTAEGRAVGENVDSTDVGMGVGEEVGTTTGRVEGASDGVVLDGFADGLIDGCVGAEVVGAEVVGVEGTRDGATEGPAVGTLLLKYDGFCVGTALSGPLNTTLKADSFGLLMEATKLMLIVPEVTTTSTGKAPSTPYPSCA